MSTTKLFEEDDTDKADDELRFPAKTNFRDKRWRLSDKREQHKLTINVVKNFKKLAKLREADSRMHLYNHLKKLRATIKNDTEILSIASRGDIQSVRNVLLNHKELQRMCTALPLSHSVVKMEQRTFELRKQLDTLKSRRTDMTEEYKFKISQFSNLQDRMKYVETFELEDDTMSKTLRKELKTSQTKVAAFRAINLTYKKIINVMIYDSIYFDTALNALQEDMNEQNALIGAIRNMAIRALPDARNLQKKFDELEQKTNTDIRTRTIDIFKHRERMKLNTENVKKLVRTDSDFVLMKNRYNRDTPSIINLKAQMTVTEKIVTELRRQTMVPLATEVYPNLLRREHDTQMLEVEIDNKQLAMTYKAEELNHGMAIKEGLDLNETDGEFNRITEIARLKDEIINEKQKQLNYQDSIKSKGEVILLLRVAFQHLLEVMQNVGAIHRADKPEYPVDDLGLPLFEFDTFDQTMVLPVPMEHNLDRLLKVIQDKINQLKDSFGGTAEKGTRPETAVEKTNLEEIKEEAKEQAEEEEEIDEFEQLEVRGPKRSLIPTVAQDDPNVPDRLRIKAAADRIVRANAKADDD